MHEAVLMDADVDKGSELRNVSNHAFELHAGFEVGDFFHAVLETGRNKLVARIAAGFFQLFKNVVESVCARGFADLAQQLRILDQLLYRDIEPGCDLFDDGVGFRMDAGDVKNIFAAADSQESRRLLERLGADAGDGGKLHAGSEFTVFIAELDDFLRGAFGDAGDVAEQGPACGIEIDADPVDAAFDNHFERFVQLALVDVVLILADADRFWIELYQFRQRVLQTAGDGDGAAYGEVEVWKFLAGDVRRGVDGCAGFVDSDGEQIGTAFRSEKIAHQRFGFPRCRAVADGDGLHAVFGYEGFERAHGSDSVVLRLMRIDDVVGEKLAGLIHHGDFATGANPRIDAQHGQLAGGRGKQDVLQVVAKYLDGL